jgi:outer membrane protein OmpA-like peptidoglycan-associated protein
MRERLQHPPRRTLLLAIALFALGSAPAALAQTAADGRVAVERFRLALDRSGVVSVEGGGVPEHLAWQTTLWLGWARDSLVLYSSPGGDEVGTLVANRLAATLSGAVGLFGWGEIGLELPFVLYQDADPGSAAVGTLPSLATAGVGDLTLVPKVRLLSQANHGIDLAVVAALAIPTGSASWVGSSGVSFAPVVAATWTSGRLRLAADLGAVLRQTRALLDVEFGSELTAQAGAGWTFEGIPLQAELAVTLATSASDPFGSANETSSELRALVWWDRWMPFRVFGGGGVGLSHGWGTPEWRAVAGVRFEMGAPERPRAAAAEPAAATPAPEPAPQTQPEPAPQTQPEPAPQTQPEPAPQTQPEPAPEPKPVPPPAPPPPAIPPPPPDRDGDGVPDASDPCPEIAGCPEDAMVRIVDGRLVFEGTVYFATDRDLIDPQSFSLLDGIARFILKHPEIGVIRVEGHTDAHGKLAHNLSLSDRRARSVVHYLVRRGVPAARLVAKGFGPTRPVADEATDEGRARNRRVEFVVVQPLAK